MKKVTLVATEDRLLADFPAQFRPAKPGTNPGILSAEYEVDPNACATKLGRWLAETVITTRFDSLLSSCSILLPQTAEGCVVRDLAERLMQRQSIANEVEAERLYVDIEDWIAERRTAIEVLGSYAFRNRVIAYKWPVFGAVAAENASTPEAYFDICAKQIRMTGGVILSVGSFALPASLVKTMAEKSGGGDNLIARHREQSARFIVPCQASRRSMVIPPPNDRV